MSRRKEKRGGMNTNGWLLLVGLLLVVGGTAVYFGNRWVGQSADRLMYPGRSQLNQTPADFDLTAETVRFTADGIELVAWYIPPTEAADGATLVYAHGFGGSRGALLEDAVALRPFGYGALLLDMRNHGESGDGVTTWGYSEANDLVAAYNYLLTRPEVNPDRIGLVGKSMGGAAAARAALQLPNLAVLVLQSSYTSFEDNLPNILPGIARSPGFLSPLVFRRMVSESGLPLAEARAVQAVVSLNVPLLVIHGQQDRLVPLAQGEAIFAAANEPKQLYIVPGAGHLNIFTMDPARFTAEMRAFLEAYLP